MTKNNPNFKTNEVDVASVLPWSPMTPKQSSENGSWLPHSLFWIPITWPILIYAQILPHQCLPHQVAICRLELSRETLICPTCLFPAKVDGGDTLPSWVSSCAANKSHFCFLFSAEWLTFLCEWTNKIYQVRYLQAETHIKQGYVLTGWQQCCCQRLSGTQPCVSWEQQLSTHQFRVHSNLIVQTAMNDKNQLKWFSFL